MQQSMVNLERSQDDFGLHLCDVAKCDQYLFFRYFFVKEEDVDIPRSSDSFDYNIDKTAN